MKKGENEGREGGRQEGRKEGKKEGGGNWPLIVAILRGGCEEKCGANL